MNLAVRKFAFLSVLALALASACGCGEQPCPPIVLDTSGVVPTVDYEPLAEVLADCVLRNGLADRDRLPQYADTLDRQLAILAVTGPAATSELFPRRADALAYWYNAHAAWSMKLLLARHCPRIIGAKALLDRQFPLDGRTTTLREIARTLASEEDFRIAAAVPGATTCCARLPRVPIEPNGFRETVDRRFAEFLNDDMRVYIDVPRRRVLIPPVLWQFRDKLIGEYDRRYRTQGATLITALLACTTGSAHRRLQEALGYREVEAVCKKLLTAKHEDKD